MSFLRPFWKFPVMLFCSFFLCVYARFCCFGQKGKRNSLLMTRRWARSMAKLLNLKISVTGDPESFHGGMIVSNHQSSLDIFIHASLFLLRFAAKKELKYTPVIGFMVGTNHPVWIDRSSPRKAKESAQLMVDAMRQGESMIVYPEGTTSDSSQGLLPFKSTAFEAALQAGTPILPVLTVYEFACQKKILWLGDVSFFSHFFTILREKEIKVAVRILPEVMPEPGEDRKALAFRLHAILEEAWRNQ